MAAVRRREARPQGVRQRTAARAFTSQRAALLLLTRCSYAHIAVDCLCDSLFLGESAIVAKSELPQTGGRVGKAGPLRWPSSDTLSLAARLLPTSTSHPSHMLSHALAPALLSQLASLSSAATLFLLLDYDGTLTPIVPDPPSAVPPPGTAKLLEAASERFNVALLTGRAAGTLHSLLLRETPPPPPSAFAHLAVAASHGCEIYVPVPPAAAAAGGGSGGGSTVHKHLPVAHVRPALQAARAMLEGVLASYPKAALEDCGFSLSLHYRHIDNEKEVSQLRRAVDHVLASFTDSLRLREGKKVWEIRPAAAACAGGGGASGLAWDKGSAARWLLETHFPVHGGWQSERQALAVAPVLGDGGSMAAGSGSASTSPATAAVSSKGGAGGSSGSGGAPVATTSPLQIAIAIGDDTTDEDTFRCVLEWAAADPLAAGGRRVALPVIVADPAATALVPLTLGSQQAGAAAGAAATGLPSGSSEEGAPASPYVPTAPDSTKAVVEGAPGFRPGAGVGNGASRPTYATHYLKDPSEVAVFIAQLTAAAAGGSGGARGTAAVQQAAAPPLAAAPGWPAAAASSAPGLRT